MKNIHYHSSTFLPVSRRPFWHGILTQPLKSERGTWAQGTAVIVARRPDTGADVFAKTSYGPCFIAASNTSIPAGIKRVNRRGSIQCQNRS